MKIVAFLGQLLSLWIFNCVYFELQSSLSQMPKRVTKKSEREVGVFAGLFQALSELYKILDLGDPDRNGQFRLIWGFGKFWLFSVVFGLGETSRSEIPCSWCVRSPQKAKQVQISNTGKENVT